MGNTFSACYRGSHASYGDNNIIYDVKDNVGSVLFGSLVELGSVILLVPWTTLGVAYTKFAVMLTSFPSAMLPTLNRQHLAVIAGKAPVKDGKPSINSNAVDTSLILNVLDHENGPAKGLPYEVSVWGRP